MHRFEAVLQPFGPAGAVTLPFDPMAEWGKVRAPVRGTIEGYPFTTTVARYGGVDYLAFRREVREGAGVELGKVVTIEVELDPTERTVEVPVDLADALAEGGMRATFDGSPTPTGRSTSSGSRRRSGSARASTRVQRTVELLREGVKTPK